MKLNVNVEIEKILDFLSISYSSETITEDIREDFDVFKRYKLY